MTESNPYAKEDGAPKEGEFEMFFEWEREQELIRLGKLSEEERKAKEKADEDLAKRMNS